MNILAKLNNQYGGSMTKHITYWGTLDTAKKDLYYVEYDGCYYEWISYDTGYGGFDYIAEYARMTRSYPPPGAIVYTIASEYRSGFIRCECGAEKLKHPGHSQWCPKFRSF